MNTKIAFRSLSLLLGAATLLSTSVQAQFDVDPKIFDAGANGAGPNSGNKSSGNRGPSISTSGIPIGGDISVLDESSLPPLGSIDIPGGSGLNIPIKMPGMPGGMSGSSSGSSEGMPIPMGGG